MVEGKLIEEMLGGRRSMEEALADLLAKYKSSPNPELATRIETLRDEIARRKGSEQGGSG